MIVLDILLDAAIVIILTAAGIIISDSAFADERTSFEKMKTIEYAVGSIMDIYA